MNEQEEPVGNMESINPNCIKNLPEGKRAAKLFHNICLSAINPEERLQFVKRLKRIIKWFTREYEMAHQTIILKYTNTLLDAYLEQESVLTTNPENTHPDKTWSTPFPCELHRILYGIWYLIEFWTEEQKEEFHKNLIVLLHNQNKDATHVIQEALAPILPKAQKNRTP